MMEQTLEVVMMDHVQHVRNTFDATANGYDGQRRKLIPCFDAFYGTAVSLAETKEAQPSILDLGAGTGLLSSLIVLRYPDARLTLMDLSEKMLSVARTRFLDNANVQYVCRDYTDYVAESKYDLIVSGLSIHHLSDSDKQAVYRNAYTSLKPGGVFINADQVLGHTPFIDELYKSDWRSKIEASGLSRAELEAAYERTTIDRMSTLSEQLEWLVAAGFAEVDCVYKSYNFVVITGRRMH